MSKLDGIVMRHQHGDIGKAVPHRLYCDHEVYVDDGGREESALGDLLPLPSLSTTTNDTILGAGIRLAGDNCSCGALWLRQTRKMTAG